MTLAPNANAWLRKYAQREASQATIVSIGDSYTEPYGATRFEYGWTALTARALGRDIAEGQSVSSHHISPDAPQSVSKTGDVTSYDPDNPHMLELARNIASVRLSCAPMVRPHVGARRRTRPRDRPRAIAKLWAAHGR